MVDLGKIEDWSLGEDGQWHREGDERVISVRDGLTFADAFASLTAPAPILIDYGVFRSRWLPAELEALFEARKLHWQVDDFVSLAGAQGHVNVSGPTAAQAKALFAQLGVLTVERADVIFATE